MVLDGVTRLATLLGATVSPGAPVVDEHVFSVQVASGTVLDVLTAAARAHGALLWSTPDIHGYHAPGTSIGVQTFDGRGAGIVVPVAEP